MPLKARGVVLVVDDDDPFRQTVSAAIGKDYELVQAASCEEALDRLKTDSACVDLVLLDVGFGAGRLQGDGALTVIAKRWPQLGVVMLSVENDVPLALRCFELGALDYVVKDAESVLELSARLARILAYVEMRRENLLLRQELDQRFALERALRPQTSLAIADTESIGVRVIRPFDDVTRDYFKYVLRECGGNMRQAAFRLEIPYHSFRRRLIELGLLDPVKRSAR